MRETGLGSFNKIIPEPEGLLDASVEEVAADYFAKHPADSRNAELEILARLGGEGWYFWRCAYWGTKWNSSFFCLVSNSLAALLEEPNKRLEFLFCTAWSFPEPVFAALAREFPTLRFECACLDECWNFAGQGYYEAVDHAMKFGDASAELYESVYGEKPEHDEGDEEEVAPLADRVSEEEQM